MFPYESLDAFLGDLEAEGELRRIGAEIDAKYDLSGLAAVLGKADGPAVLCENMRANVPIPMLTWLWGSWKRTAMALGAGSREEAIEKVSRATQDESSWLPPVVVDSGPCKEIVIPEGEIDVWQQLPAIWGGELEHNAYITQGLTISKDPETGIRNAGPYRHAFLDTHPQTGEAFSEADRKRCFGSFIAPGGNHAGTHLEKRKGQPLEIAIAVGVEPTVLACTAAVIGYGKDELALAGALRGRPVELVRCETVDLEVPATAHFVIEAEVLGTLEDATVVGPFGEFFGGTLRSTVAAPKTRIRCITRRRDAVWPMVVETHQPPIYEHALWVNVMETASLYRIRDWVPHIRRIHIPVPPGNMHQGLVVVQIEKKPYPNFARQVMRAIWSMKPGVWAKYILVVDADVDPENYAEIMVAMQNNVQPARDIVISADGPQIHGWDPSVCGLPTELPIQALETPQSQMGIDATVKVPERIRPEADPRPRWTRASRALEQRVYEKLRGELGLP